MHILELLLPLFAFFWGNVEGTALEGNPMRPLTDEEEIKLTISMLEYALVDKEERLVPTFLSERANKQEIEEVKTNFAEHVLTTGAPEGKPLVYLRVFEVNVDGNKAEAKVEAFSYGGDKRIKAVHRIAFKKEERGWCIADAEVLNRLLQQIGGIEPVQQPEASKVNEVPKTEIAPVEPIEEKLQPDAPKIKIIPIDKTPAEGTEVKPSGEPSEGQVSPPVESTTTEKEESQ